MADSAHIEAFKKELREADWYYAMSDDYSVYRAGVLRFKQLELKAQAIGPEGVQAMKDIRIEKTGA